MGILQCVILFNNWKINQKIFFKNLWLLLPTCYIHPWLHFETIYPLIPPKNNPFFTLVLSWCHRSTCFDQKFLSGARLTRPLLTLHANYYRFLLLGITIVPPGQISVIEMFTDRSLTPAFQTWGNRILAKIKNFFILN